MKQNKIKTRSMFQEKEDEQRNARTNFLPNYEQSPLTCQFDPPKPNETDTILLQKSQDPLTIRTIVMVWTLASTDEEDWILADVGFLNIFPKEQFIC